MGLISAFKFLALFRPSSNPPPTVPQDVFTWLKALLWYPHTRFTLIESDKTPDTEDSHSLLTLPVSYGAVGTGAAHQYAKTWAPK